MFYTCTTPCKMPAMNNVHSPNPFFLSSGPTLLFPQYFPAAPATIKHAPSLMGPTIWRFHVNSLAIAFPVRLLFFLPLSSRPNLRRSIPSSLSPPNAAPVGRHNDMDATPHCDIVIVLPRPSTKQSNFSVFHWASLAHCHT